MTYRLSFRFFSSTCPEKISDYDESSTLIGFSQQSWCQQSAFGSDWSWILLAETVKFLQSGCHQCQCSKLGFTVWDFFFIQSKRLQQQNNLQFINFFNSRNQVIETLWNVVTCDTNSYATDSWVAKGTCETAKAPWRNSRRGISASSALTRPAIHWWPKVKIFSHFFSHCSSWKF